MTVEEAQKRVSSLCGDLDRITVRVCEAIYDLELAAASPDADLDSALETLNDLRSFMIASVIPTAHTMLDRSPWVAA